MAQVFRTEAAENDLQEIAYYIAVKDRRPLTAERIVDEILSKCRRYADSPEIGTSADHLGVNYRFFAHKRWVVVYRPVSEGILVLRIVDGARDFSKLF